MVRSEEGRTVNIRRVTRFNRIKSLLTLRRFTPVTRTAIDPMNNVKPLTLFFSVANEFLLKFLNIFEINQRPFALVQIEYIITTIQ